MIFSFFGAILAAGAAGVVIVGQRAALTRLSTDVPVSIPWIPIGEITATCGAVAIVASVLSAWRGLRGRVVELAGVWEWRRLTPARASGPTQIWSVPTED